MKKCLNKILAIAVTVVMLLALLYVPVSAGVIHTGAFSNVDASATEYSVEQFLEDFVPAPYAIVQTFENSGNYTPEGMDGEYGKTAKTMTSNVTIPIEGGSATYNYTLENEAGKTAYRYSQKEEGIYSSGTRAIELFSTGKAIRFTPQKDDNKNMVRGHREYNLVTFALTIYTIVDTQFTATIVYDDDTTFEENYNLEADKSYFLGFKVPEDKKYIKDITITNSASFAFDDIAVIVDITEESVVSSVGVSGPDAVYAPYWGSTKGESYEYSTAVLDQFFREMPDEPVTVEFSSTSDAVTFENGILTVMQADDLPETVTITVTSVENPSMTASKDVTIKNEPYYRSDRVSSVKMGRKTTDSPADVNDALLTRDEFVAKLDAARGDESKDMAMVNFEVGEVSGSGTLSLPLANRNDKNFTLATGAKNLQVLELTNGLEAGVKLVVNISGEKYGYLQSTGQGGNEFIFDTTDMGNLKPTALGLVIMAYNGLNEADGFRITATYSNGQQSYFTQDMTSGGKVWERWVDNNIFFGIQAPPGHYITNLEILNSASNSNTYSRYDEFGFLFEEPDILDIERDYEELTFSKLSNDDMNNITNNLTLPPVIGESTITWSTEPAGIIAQDGTLTPPDLPAADGTTPKVNLIGTFSSGVLTKERIFELYVPSKFEREIEAIDIPSRTDEDLTLPTTGSVFGSTITWSSDDHSLIDDEGRVTRPKETDEYVVLTATITTASGSMSKDFGVTVEGIYKSSSSGGGGGGTGGGGKSSSIGNFAAVPGLAEPKTPVETKTPTSSVFGDLEVSHWAHDSIMKLYEKSIVNGTSENAYEPEGVVTREQFLAMLVRAFELTAEENGADFSDVAPESWYAESVRVAAALGISGGYDDGTFGVGKKITREEMAVMAHRAAIVAGKAIEEADLAAGWSDAGDISEFAAPAISALNKAGIINGVSDSEFSPKTTTTRAQAAVIICRLLEVDFIAE